jgi:hypothetical protein
MDMSRLWRILLLVVAGFNALSAIGGGIGLIAPGSLGMPSAWIDGTGFSYVTTGVILLVVVGGTQTAAFVLLLLRRPYALLANAVAGFGMVLWIYVEVALLPVSSILQTIYIGTGIAQLALTLACLGVLRRDAGIPHRAPPGIPHS